MTPTFQFFSSYGIADTFYFTVPVPAGTNDDRLLNAAVPWIAGDVKISKNGGAVANITSLPTRIGTTPIYSMALTAAEMSAEWIVVYLVDANGPAWRDTTIIVSTVMRLGRLVVDATQIGGNYSALDLTGVGNKCGLQVEGASDAYITNLFDQLEGTEPSGAPADNASFAAIWRDMKRRFTNRILQTSTAQTRYKDDSVTICWSRVVSDDSSTFTIQKVS